MVDRCSIGTKLLLAMALFAGALAAPRLRAQEAAGTVRRPQFDVASVKLEPNANGPGYSMDMIQQGRLVYTNVNLKGLISSAYQLKPDQSKIIEGLPKWAQSQTFDVEGRAPGDTRPELIRLMLQSLLQDRFHLMMHTEMRDVPVYALGLTRAGKTGPQLQPHSDASPCQQLAPGKPAPTSDFGVVPPPPPVCGRFMSGARRLAGNNVSMEMLAANLEGMSSIDRPVVDRTGLSEKFDLTLTFTPGLGQTNSGAGAADPSAPPALVTALADQLGLKLESAKAPVYVVVIDHVEEPTAN